jgi:hypothetical protein
MKFLILGLKFRKRLLVPTARVVRSDGPISTGEVGRVGKLFYCDRRGFEGAVVGVDEGVFERHCGEGFGKMAEDGY